MNKTLHIVVNLVLSIVKNNKKGEFMTGEIKLSNPAPLGLLGFAMTTLLLNLHNAGFYENSSMIVAMGIFYGGIAQLIAGLIEFKQGKTFGGVAFVSYGSFWLSLCAIWLLPKTGLIAAPDHLAMGFYLLIWGLFTFFMFVGTLKSNRISQCVFGTLTLLFALLAIENFLGNAGAESAMKSFKIMAGYTGIVCAGFAFYDAIAQILSPIYDKKFPLT